MPRISRMKKTNKVKKEILKNCLVAVLIGATGTIGSFAYFTSHADVKANLTVATGTMKVSLGNNLGNETNSVIQISDLKPGNPSGKSTFKIKNNGTLTEKVVVSIKKDENIASNLLSKISYDITFNGNDKQSGNMNESKDFIPKNGKKNENKDKDIELKPGESITCEFMATLKTTEANGDPLNDKYSNTKIKFPVSVKAIQVN